MTPPTVKINIFIYTSVTHIHTFLQPWLVKVCSKEARKNQARKQRLHCATVIHRCFGSCEPFDSSGGKRKSDFGWSSIAYFFSLFHWRPFNQVYIQLSIERKNSLFLNYGWLDKRNVGFAGSLEWWSRRYRSTTVVARRVGFKVLRLKRKVPQYNIKERQGGGRS